MSLHFLSPTNNLSICWFFFLSFYFSSCESDGHVQPQPPNWEFIDFSVSLLSHHESDDQLTMSSASASILNLRTIFHRWMVLPLLNQSKSQLSVGEEKRSTYKAIPYGPYVYKYLHAYIPRHYYKYVEKSSSYTKPQSLANIACRCFSTMWDSHVRDG